MMTFVEVARSAMDKSDKKRDEGLFIPSTVKAYKDLSYGGAGDFNLLDVYYPQGTTTKLPVIVSVHGGGFIYGTKEVYQYYCASLAEHGFVVINFNYRLAPEHKFPSQLEDISGVFDWMVESQDDYFLDVDNVFMVGDSAGANLTSHFMTIKSNSMFGRLFDFRVTDEINVLGVALNCGLYDISKKGQKTILEVTGRDEDLLLQAYLGNKQDEIESQVDFLPHINNQYPHTFVQTSSKDFLRDLAKPMHEYLVSKGVESVYKCYGDEHDEHMTHVFHVNMKLEEAHVCNQEQISFFKKLIKKD